jgi:hypothetical protein
LELTARGFKGAVEVMMSAAIKAMWSVMRQAGSGQGCPADWYMSYLIQGNGLSCHVIYGLSCHSQVTLPFDNPLTEVSEHDFEVDSWELAQNFTSQKLLHGLRWYVAS